MSVWDLYESVNNIKGTTKRDSFYNREARYITDKIKHSLSYHHAIIDDEERDVAIINSDNLNEKKILSMPGESIRHGALVDWMDKYWLITEKDANTTLYEKGKMIQCNYLLKWVSSDAVIHEQWCIVDDGTKYLTGEYEDRNFVLTRGDTRLSVTIAVNEDTAKLGRTTRVLIDHPLADPMLAYGLSKPLKIGTRYSDEDGVFKFVLQEVTTTDNDNQELGIADYYKYFPRESEPEDSGEDNPEDTNDTQEEDTTKRKVWI